MLSTDGLFVLQEDQFGPFSDAAAAPTDGEPYSFTADEDASYENFGDFGDFQGGEGDLTPTAGSWSFASDTSISSTSSEEPEVIEADHSSMDSNSPQHLRTEL